MKLNFNANTVSNILTVVIFVLVGVLLVNYFRSVNKTSPDQTSSAATESTPEMSVPEVVKTGLPAEYTVKKGDSLWKISLSAYGTGYNWTEIYNSNKDDIKNPDLLEVGSKITLPKIEIKPVEYTVKKGDNLWNISLRICKNGFLWTKIASDNKVSTPNIIEPGLKLTINCQ